MMMMMIFQLFAIQSWMTSLEHDTIQYNKIIINVHMVSWTVESDARAGTRGMGKLARCGSKRRHGKNTMS